MKKNKSLVPFRVIPCYFSGHPQRCGCFHYPLLHWADTIDKGHCSLQSSSQYPVSQTRKVPGLVEVHRQSYLAQWVVYLQQYSIIYRDNLTNFVSYNHRRAHTHQVNWPRMGLDREQICLQSALSPTTKTKAGRDISSENKIASPSSSNGEEWTLCSQTSNRPSSRPTDIDNLS